MTGRCVVSDRSGRSWHCGIAWGYVLQVMGWHVKESNGGVKTHHPVFLSRQLVGTLFIVAMNVLIYGWLYAAAELLKPGHGPTDQG